MAKNARRVVIQFLCNSFAEDLRQIERKFRRIRKLVKSILEKLERNPNHGDRIQPYVGCSKTWVGSDYRLIYYYNLHTGLLVPLALYAKNVRSDISAKEIAQRMREFRDR